VILQNVTGSVVVTRGGRTVAAATLGPGTFVTGTSIAYPLVAPHEQPPEGTVYRLRAIMRYRGGIARLDRRLVFGAQAAKIQHEFGGPAPPGAGTPWWAFALGVAGLAGGLIVLLFRRRRRESGPSRRDYGGAG
jgi:LPXTG-motif cell wall-anchored protein